MVKAKVHKFSFDEEEEVEYDLIGICSSSPHYKLAWDLNKSLLLELEYSENLFEVYDKKRTLSSFPYFIQEIKEDLLSIYLIKNKLNGKTLIQELNQIDYFLIYVNNQFINTNDVLRQLKEKTSTIQAAFKFTPNDYPSTSNLIFEKHEKD